jgi:arylsulfatase A-like enzyme
MKNLIVSLFLIGSACICLADDTKPNIIVILADDVGYGDLGCYGAKPKHVQTPNLDRLAAEGIRFTDGHSASSVCTPSRWSLLTGNYAFRSTLGGKMILPGDAPLTIKPGSLTLPAMFKQQGYTTGIVGKWHLGLGNPRPKNPKANDVNWNDKITNGPEAVGFDESFIIPATGDRVPTVFVRNGKVDNLDPADPITVSYKKRIRNEPTAITNPELATVLLGKRGEGHSDAITRGVSRIGFMTGGKAALWNDADISDTLLAESVKFVEKNKSRPFFLYLATHGIHEPRIPHQRFVGKSGCGTYGDVILELDDLVGQLLANLKRLNLDDNTLIVFSSDNGGGTEGGTGRYDYGKGADRRGHAINGVLRGGKGNVYEGGTRVPFIVRWPAKIPGGKVSPALVSQTDLIASFTRLLGQKLPKGVAIDSVDVLDALLGKSVTGRGELIEHKYLGTNGSALRRGNWKLINGQLYDLATDLGEKKDVSAENPQLVAELTALMKKIIAADRRTLGPK